MLKPNRLKPGDKIAVVSLSSGILGEPDMIHKYYIAKDRLENDFGLIVHPMPHALKGVEFIANHPELRARDLMEAFQDSSIAAIFCAIGGEDSIRLLPYINFDIIRQNPKIFMGYSDTTSCHLMMYKAGLVSFYGPSVMCEFGEYGKMFDYTVHAIKKMLFGDTAGYQITPSDMWSKDYILWKEENMNTRLTLIPDVHGYELLQGEGCVSGHLLGGCIDVFTMANGTCIWPSTDDWRGAILFFETSEGKPSPEFILFTLRSLAAQGILKVINGILVGKPQGEVYYEEYKKVLLQVLCNEEHLDNLPVFYNVNFGHAKPIGILPYGIQTQLDCTSKTITLLENAVL